MDLILIGPGSPHDLGKGRVQLHHDRLRQEVSETRNHLKGARNSLDGVGSSLQLKNKEMIFSLNFQLEQAQTLA